VPRLFAPLAPAALSARAVVVVATLVSCSLLPIAEPRTAGEPTLPPAGAPRPTERPVFWVEAPIAGDPSPVFGHIPATGVVVEGRTVRLLPPKVAAGQRRVGIQAGHWRTAEAPAEFPRLRSSIGGSSGDVKEVDVTLDVARRVTDLLRGRGIVADLIPATVPPSYVADAFVALHADADDTGTARGFKIARGTYRSPHDARLVELLTEHYGAATGLPWDPHVTDDMTDYYAFAWFRYEHALAPHTPAAIVEMGFISHSDDRELLLEEQDLVSRAIVEGILRFLDAVPRSALFANDIVVPIVPAPSVTPTPLPSR
jgi:N-acetylmuramoyl-L-alanine amidase